MDKGKSTDLKCFNNDSKAFAEYSNDLDDIYKKYQRIQPK